MGKTIEAGLLIAQRWAERKRRILVITPANLRKRDGLIDALERQLKQEISVSTVLTCEWELI